MQEAPVNNTTPFPTMSSPPGLELADSSTDPAQQDAARDALLADVDAKVAAKVEVLWTKGKQMLSQVQQKSQEKTDKLADEIAKVVEKQKAMEAENEQLKQMLCTMAQRLSLISTAFGGNNPATQAAAAACAANLSSLAPSAAGGSSVASASPPPTSGSVAEPFTPISTCDPMSFDGPLPQVPAFPFPATATPTTTAATAVGNTAAQLSLVEALGATPANSSVAPSPARSAPTPLSLASSLPPTPETTFSFTLRKADETDLGLNVSHSRDDRALIVEGVRADGAVDAWNRQCAGGAFPEKAVLQGDRIISVNEVVADPDKMLKECKEKRLLRLTIVRGGIDCESGMPTAQLPDGSSAKIAQTSLRADASEFVPGAFSGGCLSASKGDKEKQSDGEATVETDK